MAYLRSLKALERRIGQKAVADKFGVSTRTVRRWKNKATTPKDTVQKQINAAYSYVRNTKPLSQVKNKQKATRSRLNKIDERLEIGYINKGVHYFPRAKTRHKTLDVSDLSDYDRLESINLLYHKEGYTSFSFTIHTKNKIMARYYTFEQETKYHETDKLQTYFYRIEDFQQEGTAIIRDMIKGVKDLYQIKEITGIDIVAIKES